MNKILWTATALLVIQLAHSYILMTANIDDLRNVAKRVVASPIGSQVGNIARKAYQVFNVQLGKARTAMRAAMDDPSSEYRFEDDFPFRRKNADDTRSEEDSRPPAVKQDRTDSDEKPRKKGSRNEKSNNEEFPSLGKSASLYLQKIKKIFQDT